MNMFKQIVASLLLCVTAGSAAGHEIWLEVNTPVVKVGEVVHIASKLGNCGNGHRDFKTSGIIDPKWTTLLVLNSQNEQTSLLKQLTHTATAPTEGFWTVRHSTSTPGLHWVVQSLDQVVEHGGGIMHGILTAKSLFITTQTLDSVQVPSAAEAIGLPIELVLESSPLPSVDSKKPIQVRVLKNGRPLPNVPISFVPQGVKLEGEFDERYQRRTDEEGRASFMPQDANLYLISTEFIDTSESSATYASTVYATTLTLHVCNTARQ
jgi:uncharacterized GH25 family protein